MSNCWATVHLDPDFKLRGETRYANGNLEPSSGETGERQGGALGMEGGGTTNSPGQCSSAIVGPTVALAHLKIVELTWFPDAIDAFTLNSPNAILNGKGSDST